MLISNANSIILGFFDILSESLSAFLMFTTFIAVIVVNFIAISNPIITILLGWKLSPVVFYH